jgi:hypothetical protein
MIVSAAAAGASLDVVKVIDWNSSLEMLPTLSMNTQEWITGKSTLNQPVGTTVDYQFELR